MNTVVLLRTEKLRGKNETGKKIYISRSVEEERQLLKLVFSNLVLKDGNLRPDWHPDFRLIAEKTKTDEQRRGWDSNPRALAGYTISNRADSTALAPLQ